MAVNSELSLAQVLQQGKDFLAGLSGRQRVLLVGGALLVGATLYGFVQLIGKPDYKTLYPGNHGGAGGQEYSLPAESGWNQHSGPRRQA
jgi:flagellar biosynthesis/type III secretory pathway M-ring protein FliF/YscJ